MHGNIKVMVVDDEPGVCDAIRRSLERKRGYTVVTTTRGEEAVALARAETPAVILLDILMPGLGGLEVATRLRSDGMTANIPIVFLTGLFTKAELSQHGPVISGERYIAKPASTSKIIEALQFALKPGDAVDGKRSERGAMQS